MPTWIIQCIEALAAHYRQDIYNSDEPLFVDCFANENDFAAALHKGGILVVAQDYYKQDDNNDNDDGNMNENPEDPPNTSLDTESPRGKTSGLTPTEHPVKIPGVAPTEIPVGLAGVAPTENEVYDIVFTLLSSDYDSNDASDDKDEDTNMFTE